MCVCRRRRRRRMFAWLFLLRYGLCVLRRGIDMMCVLEVVVELYRFEALCEL